MLFITNRALRQSVRSRLNRKVDFSISDNSACQHLYYCERTAPGEYREIKSDGFMEQLRNSKAEQVLFFVHGFSNLPEPNIFPLVEYLQKFFNDYQKNLVEVIPIIWPCDDDKGILKDYFDDQRAADASAFAFARALGKFDDWRNNLAAKDIMCLKRINVLCHSMGNRVFRGATRDWVDHDQFGHPPLLFRNIFLMAADIRHDTLEEGKPGEYIPDICRNLVVYHAADDLALRASKTVNKGNRISSLRMGHKGPRDLDKVPKNVYSIDAGFVNQDYDPPKGHTYFINQNNKKSIKPGNVFEHLANCIKKGSVVANSDRTLEIQG
ncbi:alpha/beta hydrolase [bacterium]|nr:alpha/beta hydrolase [bacterium]